MPAAALIDRHLLRDLACVWVEVSDLEQAASIMVDGVGLVRLDGGTLRAGEGPEGASREDDRPWVLLGSADEPFGRLCLVAGRDRPPSTALPRGWDCVEIVVDDVDAAASRLAACPDVVALGAPFTADLRDSGSNMHRTGVWLMPWGNHLILTHGLTEPQGRAFPSTDGRAGRVFEVHVRSDRYADARPLYDQVLGLRALMDVRWEGGAIHDAWSLPEGQPVEMALLKTGGEGTGNGAVELQGHVPAALAPPREAGRSAGGTLAVTFTCDDLDLVLARLRSDGRFPVTDPEVIAGGPFVGLRGVTVQGAEGEALELVEPASSGQWEVADA